MAHSVSAKKRIRQNLKARARNRWRLRTMREALKDLDDKLLHSSYEEARESYQSVCKILDRTAQKGVIHKNAAARKKSRLAKRVLAKKSA
ncbi:MAG: 30S ribosomal protein S20 [Planctomycetota bacterium]